MPGPHRCTKCPINTWNNKIGSTSIINCRFCSKDKTTNNIDGNTNSNQCLCKRHEYYQLDNGKCQKCPKGANCNLKDGMQLHELTPLPGYWRKNNSISIFSGCHKVYTTADATTLGKQRCCPMNSSSTVSHETNVVTSINQKDGNNTQVSICNRPIQNSSDEQCKIGYGGVVCRACTFNYVLVGDTCEYCHGGASIYSAFFGIFVFFFPIFFILLIYLTKMNDNLSTATVGANTAATKERNAKVFGQIKIIINFLQIVTSISTVFHTSIPWPENFLLITKPFDGLFNLNLINYLSLISCSMSVNYHHQFIVHISIPLICIFLIMIAYVLSNTIQIIQKKKRIHANKTMIGGHLEEKEKEEMKSDENYNYVVNKKIRRSATIKVIILVMLMLYPGLATKIFSMFRCEHVEGVSNLYLIADYSVQCNSDEHQLYIGLAILYLLLYLIGVSSRINRIFL